MFCCVIIILDPVSILGPHFILGKDPKKGEVKNCLDNNMVHAGPRVWPPTEQSASSIAAHL